MGKAEKFEFIITRKRAGASIRLRRRQPGVLDRDPISISVDRSTLYQLSLVVSRVEAVLQAYAKLSVTEVLVGESFIDLRIGIPESDPRQRSFGGNYAPSGSIRSACKTILGNFGQRCHDLVQWDETKPDIPVSELRGIDKRPASEKVHRATDALVRTLVDCQKFDVVKGKAGQKIIELPPKHKVPADPPKEHGPVCITGYVTGFDDSRPIIDSEIKLPYIPDVQPGQQITWESEDIRYERKSIRVISDPAQRQLDFESKETKK